MPSALPPSRSWPSSRKSRSRVRKRSPGSTRTEGSWPPACPISRLAPRRLRRGMPCHSQRRIRPTRPSVKRVSGIEDEPPWYECPDCQVLWKPVLNRGCYRRAAASMCAGKRSATCRRSLLDGNATSSASARPNVVRCDLGGKRQTSPGTERRRSRAIDEGAVPWGVALFSLPRDLLLIRQPFAEQTPQPGRRRAP